MRVLWPLSITIKRLGPMGVENSQHVTGRIPAPHTDRSVPGNVLTSLPASNGAAGGLAAQACKGWTWSERPSVSEPSRIADFRRPRYGV